MKRSASAVWSGVLINARYGFTTRFGEEKGTNPEELIAAAEKAKAGCPISRLLGAAAKIAMDAKLA